MKKKKKEYGMKKFAKLFILIVALSAGCTGLQAPDTDKQLIRELNNIDLETLQIEQGIKVKLPAVMLFDYDSDKLKIEAITKIYQIAAILNRPEVNKREVIINGHADAAGDKAYNLALSRKRADAVADQFVFNGVHKSRIASYGYGDTMPTAPNTLPDGSDNPRGRAKNRRVEVIIKSLKTSD